MITSTFVLFSLESSAAQEGRVAFEAFVPGIRVHDEAVFGWLGHHLET